MGSSNNKLGRRFLKEIGDLQHENPTIVYIS